MTDVQYFIYAGCKNTLLKTCTIIFSVLWNIRKHTLYWKTRQHNIVWVRVLGVCIRKVLMDSVTNNLHFTNKISVQEAVWRAILTLREQRWKYNMLLIQVIIFMRNQTVFQFLIKCAFVIWRIRCFSISYTGKKDYLYKVFRDQQ